MGFSEGFARGFGIANETYEGIRRDEREKAELAYRDQQEKRRLEERRQDLDRADSRDARDLSFRVGEVERGQQNWMTEQERLRTDRDRTYSLDERKVGLMEADSRRDAEADRRASEADKRAAAADKREQEVFDYQKTQREEQDQASAADRVWRSLMSQIEPDQADVEKIKGTRFDLRRFADPRMGEDLAVMENYFKTGTGDFTQLSTSASRLFNPVLRQGVGQKASGQYVPDRFQGWTVVDKTLDSLESISPRGGNGRAQARPSGFASANVLVRVKSPETGEIGVYRAPLTVGRQMGGTPSTLDLEGVVDYWQGNRILYDSVQNNPNARRFFEKSILTMNASQNDAIRKAVEARHRTEYKDTVDQNRERIQQEYAFYAKAQDESGEAKIPYKAFEQQFVDARIGILSDKVAAAQGLVDSESSYGNEFDGVTSESMLRDYQPYGARNEADAYYLYGLEKSSNANRWELVNDAVKELTGMPPSISMLKKYEKQLFGSVTANQFTTSLEEMIKEIRMSSGDKLEVNQFDMAVDR